jgi:hypothetical protein
MMSELIELNKLEDEAIEMFNELNKREVILGQALGLEFYDDSGYSFYEQILPEIRRIKEKADRYDAQEKGAR